jgi:hypothetical protein
MSFIELTAEEKKWIKSVQRALNKCPSVRLGFYTIGDNDLSIYDTNLEHKFDQDKDFGHAVAEVDAGASETLIFPSCVHSTAG